MTGHEPMTGAQASYLKTLSEQAHDPDAYEPDLDKAEASKRIDHLKQETGANPSLLQAKPGGASRPPPARNRLTRNSPSAPLR